MHKSAETSETRSTNRPLRQSVSEHANDSATTDTYLHIKRDLLVGVNNEPL